MYLPREIISHLYQHLKKTHHSASPPVLLLVSLDPDALCACRILTLLLRRDYIPHKIHPVAGYGDLAEAGVSMVQPMRRQQGGEGGLVICLGVGGLVDLSNVLGLDDTDNDEDPSGGVEVWIMDARRPWNLGNIFGGNATDSQLEGVNGNGSHLKNGVDEGRIATSYRPGQGGIIVYDDGDIDEEMTAEREAYCALAQMPEVEDDGESDYSTSDDENTLVNGNGDSKKRKSSDDEDLDSEFEDARPRQRRRSNSDDFMNGDETTLVRNPLSVSPSPSPPPSQPEQIRSRSSSPRKLRRRLLRLRRKHTATLTKYYSLGTSYSEPISSIAYSLAESLGREDNDILWNSIVGVSSLELYGRGMSGVGISISHPAGGSAGWAGNRGERIRQLLRDEVRRLNPPDVNDTRGEILRGEASGVIPTTARSPDDNSIRLSPEPRFLLIRHWSLYDSMLHSPYLASRLHTWSDVGRKRLHKLLAKMGVSLTQCKQSYTHMDMDLKRGLRQRLLTYAPMYGLEGLVPPAASNGQGRRGWGFVRSWGWKACLSATDVGVIIGAILEVGSDDIMQSHSQRGYSSNGTTTAGDAGLVDEEGKEETASYVSRFFEAYDALSDPTALKAALPIAQHLHRAMLRTGATLLEKKQIRHLKAFRMGVVRDGPDVELFTHPAALTKLALWVAEAINQKEGEGKVTPLVLATLNDPRGVYVVVGTGGGGGVIDWEKRKRRKEKAEAKAKRKADKQLERAKRKRQRAELLEEDLDDIDSEEEEEEEEDTEDEDDDDSNDGNDDDDEHMERAAGRNRFGNAFQEVVDETNARVRIDSFEHCVVEVKKEDLNTFLEALSMKVVVG